jgi:hypothetical protein
LEGQISLYNSINQSVEKHHDRWQEKAKSDEKEEFMCDK